ncbi:MAG: Ig-like domain-containing protein, partial [Thermoanaerobaculia bacterium]|nr:Ig-like domain-containing protein [Thermoanaerobaculia bacterium]
MRTTVTPENRSLLARGAGATPWLVAFFFVLAAFSLNAQAQNPDPFSLGPMTPYAYFSAQNVTVSGKVESTGGTSTSQGHVRSNGNITVNSGGKIDGDARPGPGKTAVTNSNGQITGITIPSLESLSPAPVDLAALETQVAAQNDNTKIDPKLIPNRNLTLSSGQSLPLQPGTYYLNNVNINSNATLTVSGLVKILVTGSFNLDSAANAGGLAPNLRVWVKSTSSVNINSNAQMRGYVYAPNATVNVNSNATLTGGIFAKQVTVNGSTGTVKRWLGTIGLGGPSVAITEPRDGDVATNLSAVLVKGTVSDPDGVGTVSVTVNGSAVTPAANGNFEKTVDLSGSSQRRITVTAVDADGQTDT